MLNFPCVYLLMGEDETFVQHMKLHYTLKMAAKCIKIDLVNVNGIFFTTWLWPIFLHTPVTTPHPMRPWRHFSNTVSALAPQAYLHFIPVWNS